MQPLQKHHKNNTELTIAFTSDLHGEIAPLKHAQQSTLPTGAEAARGQPTRILGRATLGGRARRAWAGSCGRWYSVLGVGNHDLELAASFRNFSARIEGGSPQIYKATTIPCYVDNHTSG